MPTTIPHFFALEQEIIYEAHAFFYGLTFDRNEVVYVYINGFKDIVEEKNFLCSVKAADNCVTSASHWASFMMVKFLFLRPVFLQEDKDMLQKQMGKTLVA